MARQNDKPRCEAQKSDASLRGSVLSWACTYGATETRAGRKVCGHHARMYDRLAAELAVTGSGQS